MTSRQLEILKFIDQYKLKHTYSPTLKDIADQFNLRSLGTVQQHINALLRRGYLIRTSHVARGLEINEKKWKSGEKPITSLHLPVLGKVAAGFPLFYEKHDISFHVPQPMIKDGYEHFLLEVEGNSMEEEGIKNGDFVVVRKQSDAKDRQIIVAQVKEGAVIKKLVKKHEHIELHSANPNFKPIIVTSEVPFKIEGLYCGLIRMQRL